MLAAGAAVLLLLTLLIFATPDGQQRGDLAQFLGRFHPLLVHLPIALLLLVPVLECVGFFQEHLRRTAAFVLALAALAALASAGLGWLLAWSGGYEGPLVTRHMWGGVSLAATSLLCCSLRDWSRKIYVAALLITMGLLVWTSDQGGKLTHGETFLTERMPRTLQRWLGVQRKTPVDPTSFYAMRVQPIFEQKCVVCHNAQKFKGKLRLDSYDGVMQGGKDGAVIRPGEPGKSELLRRVSLAADNKDFMPAEGKPALSVAEIKAIETWIAGGATIHIANESTLDTVTPSAEKAAPPLTADYRPQAKTIADLESSLGIRLVPRSQNPTDGLILRTVSAPERCTDATLAQLAPVASLIVDAELARTRVTDKGMHALAGFPNLRSLDLSGTAVTSAGTADLMGVPNLESLNLTHTQVTREGIARLQTKPGLKKLYFFEIH